MRKEKRRIVLVCLGVFALLAFIYAITTNNALMRDREHTVAQAQLNAQVYEGLLRSDFDQGVSITETLEQVIVNGHGVIHDFPSVAKNLMRDYTSSIQIAPEGVVTEIYPMEGNEAGLIDLLSDPNRGPVVQYGIDHDAITMQGPFELKQGGVGIAVRNPVFLTDDDGNRTFWGLTIVILKTPELFRFELDSMESFGYDYVLSTTTSPLGDESKVVMSTRNALTNPVQTTFEEGGCTWCLEVAPKSGWHISNETIVECLVGGVLVLLLTATTAMMAAMLFQRKQLRIAAETDPLTGLLNRKGMRSRLQSYMQAHPDGPFTEVFLDIDDFKLVNDLYGHDIGDEALKNLAKNLVKVFGDQAVVSRTGGDEFGVFLPGKTAEQAEPLIHEASGVDQTFTTEQGKTYTYTISMGYADYPAQASSREELAKNVDSALYNVKLNGKHGCQRYVPGMVKQSRQQLGFTQKELLISLPGAGFICHAEDTSILYASDDLINLLECDSLADFNRFSLGQFRNIIHPDDFERVMEDRARKIAGQDEGCCISCSFRVVTKTGKVRDVIARARFLHHETFGDLFFVTAMDVDDA